MIIKAGRYLVVENKEDITERIMFGGCFYYDISELDEITFPCCFEYIDSFDLHFCGNWKPCEIDKVEKALEEEFNKLTEIMEAVRFTYWGD